MSAVINFSQKNRRLELTMTVTLAPQTQGLTKKSAGKSDITDAT